MTVCTLNYCGGMNLAERDGLPTRTRTWSSRLGGGSFIQLNYREAERLILIRNRTNVMFDSITGRLAVIRHYPVQNLVVPSFAVLPIGIR